MNPHNHTNPASPAFPCAFCGYNLSGVKLGGKCPECGNVVNFVANRPYQANGAAVASLVLGIVSVVGCVAYGVLSIVCGPLAIYFAGKATKNIQRGLADPSTRGMATGGRICGIIGTCLGGIWLLFILFYVVIVVLALVGAGAAGGAVP